VKQARFTRPQVTTSGRIGHPVALDRKLVKCAGVSFEDRWEGKRWTFRKYDAYRDLYPAMDIWTVQVLLPVKLQRGPGTSGYGPQTPVTEEAVPDEVKEYAMAQLVRLRLKGEVRG
jgi:hypothetical protein